MTLLSSGEHKTETISGEKSYPATELLAGSLSTNGTDDTVLNGTGTDLSSVEVGDFVWANNEKRKVTANFAAVSKHEGTVTQEGTQRLDIDRAFTAPLVAEPVNILKGYRGPRSISILNLGATDGSVNEAAIAPGEARTLGPNQHGLEPVIMDGTGTSLRVQIEY